MSRTDNATDRETSAAAYDPSAKQKAQIEARLLSHVERAIQRTDVDIRVFDALAQPLRRAHDLALAGKKREHRARLLRKRTQHGVDLPADARGKRAVVERQLFVGVPVVAFARGARPAPGEVFE